MRWVIYRGKEEGVAERQYSSLTQFYAILIKSSNEIGIKMNERSQGIRSLRTAIVISENDVPAASCSVA